MRKIAFVLFAINILSINLLGQNEFKHTLFLEKGHLL